MKIGVRAHDYGKREIREMAELLAERGFDCAQLALPKAFCEIESYDDIDLGLIDRIRSAFEDAKVEISVFGCYMDLANPDDDIRAAAVRTFKKCLAWNKDLGAEVVGTETAYPHLTRKQREQWRPYMYDSIAQITEEAARLGVKAAIEAVYWHPLENLDIFLSVMERVNDGKHLRLIFDASNLLEYPDQTDQGALWRSWLSRAGRYMSAMHIKDFRLDEGGRYVPTALGAGVMDYTEIVAWLRENGKSLPVLREEMMPETDGQDIGYLRQW